MSLTHQDTAVNQLIINKLTKQEFENLPSHSDTELYIVPEQLDNVVTQGSTNPVTSGAVYDFIQENKEIIFCHLTDGSIFNETVIECTEVNGEIFDPQELIDRPNDPRPLFPDGNYYYATNTNKVYSGEVGDNEFTDVTTSVMMEGDETKLYCDIDDNKLYRYDGTNFIMVGGGGVTSYNDLTDKPLSVENSKVKYTLSDGTTKLTLAQEADLKSVAFSGSYNDLTDKLQNATTSAAGLMSAEDKNKLTDFIVKTINIQPSTGESWESGFKRFVTDLTALFPILERTTTFKIGFTFYNKVLIMGGAYSTLDYANVDNHYYYCNFCAMRLLGNAKFIYQFGYDGTNWYYRTI